MDTGVPANDFEDADLGPLDRLMKDSTYNRNAIHLMAEAIQECQTQEQLAETMGKLLSNFVRKLGHRTFPDRQLNKDFVRILSRAFKDKVEDIVSILKQKMDQDTEGAKSQCGQVLKYIIDVVFDSLSEHVKDFNETPISSDATRIVLRLLNDMLSGYGSQLKGLNFTQSIELTCVIFAHFLPDVTSFKRLAGFNKEFDELIFTLLYKTLGIKVPNYKVFLRADLAAGRYMFLGKCLAFSELEKDVKSQITNELIENLEKSVLNDKEQVAYAEKSLMYFSAFLAAVQKDEVDEKVLPQIQFIMNRSSRFIGVNAKLIMFLKNYKIENMETLK